MAPSTTHSPNLMPLRNGEHTHTHTQCCDRGLGKRDGTAPELLKLPPPSEVCEASVTKLPLLPELGLGYERVHRHLFLFRTEQKSFKNECKAGDAAH